MLYCKSRPRLHFVYPGYAHEAALLRPSSSPLPCFTHVDRVRHQCGSIYPPLSDLLFSHAPCSFWTAEAPLCGFCHHGLSSINNHNICAAAVLAFAPDPAAPLQRDESVSKLLDLLLCPGAMASPSAAYWFLQPLRVDHDMVWDLYRSFLTNFPQLAAESSNQFLPTPISDSILRPVSKRGSGR